MGGSFVLSDKRSGSIESREFLDELRNCQRLKKDSAPWN